MLATLIADDTYIRSDYHSIIMDETFLSLQSYLSTVSCCFLFNIMYIHMMFLFFSFIFAIHTTGDMKQNFTIFMISRFAKERKRPRGRFLYTKKKKKYFSSYERAGPKRRNEIFFNSGAIEFIIF